MIPGAVISFHAVPPTVEDLGSTSGVRVAGAAIDGLYFRLDGPRS